MLSYLLFNYNMGRACFKSSLFAKWIILYNIWPSACHCSRDCFSCREKTKHQWVTWITFVSNVSRAKLYMKAVKSQILSSIGKGCRPPSFEQTWVLLTQGCWALSLLEIRPDVLTMYFRYYLPLIMMVMGEVLHNKLESPTSKDA